MSSQFAIAKRIVAAGALALTPALCLADGITVNFRGAIVEEPCAVSAGRLNYAAGNLQRPPGRGVIASAPLELSLNCHAAQAVRISFEQGGRETRAGFGTGVDGVTMTMSRNGRELPPGEVIALAMASGQQRQVRLDTQLRGAATSSGETVHSAILVSLDYR